MFGWLRYSDNGSCVRTTRRVLLAIPSYRGGGAERVVTTLARRLAREQFEVHLVVVQNEGPLGDDLPPDVIRHSLDRRRVSQAALPLLRLVRQLQPDVLLTSTSHLNVLAGMLRPFFPHCTRLVVRETGVLATSLATWRAGRIFQPLLAAAYRQADRVIGQSEFAIDEIHNLFSVPKDRLVRIANPVEIDRIALVQQTASPSPFLSGPGPFLLGVGRLGPEKGFDRAIRSLPPLKQTHPHSQLWIIGEGSERDSLQQLAHHLGVADSVFLPGFQPDVARWMSHADLFVLSSRTESLPNVLLEAVACQCPVVSLEHPGGTPEVLASLGLSDRWVASLDPWLPRWFTRPEPQVHQRLTEHYHWQHIVSEYEQLFAAVSLPQPATSGQQSAISNSLLMTAGQRSRLLPVVPHESPELRDAA